MPRKTRFIVLLVPIAQYKGLNALVKQGVYPNRSAAIRDAIRELLIKGNRWHISHYRGKTT